MVSMRRAVELSPDSGSIHCNLGTLLHDLGRTEESIVSYRRAIELKPDLAVTSKPGHPAGRPGAARRGHRELPSVH